MPPPLRAAADTTRPLGHARIVLRGVPEGGDLRFCLVREGYPAAHLGPRGWQLGEALLEPAAVESEGGAPVLVLPPALVRHVEPGPLTLRLPALGRDLTLFWPADIPVYDESDDALALAVAERKAKAEAERRRKEAGGGAGAGAGGAPGPVVTPPPPPPPPPAPSRLPWLLLALLVVAAGAAGAWWWFGREAPPERQIALPPVGAPVLPPPPEWPEGTDLLSLAEVVARAPNPQGILAVALRRQAAGRHDDALVLFEEAADRGVAAAYTALGRLYDPNGFRPGRPFTAPDLRQAADYYRRAAQAGDTQVLPLREALKAYLEAAAAAGNVTAAEALREFWP
jgi:hypothetical protein